MRFTSVGGRGQNGPGLRHEKKQKDCHDCTRKRNATRPHPKALGLPRLQAAAELGGPMRFPLPREGQGGGSIPLTPGPHWLLSTRRLSLLVKRDIEGRREPYVGVVCPGG